MVRTRAIGVRSLPRQTWARDLKNRSSFPRPRLAGGGENPPDLEIGGHLLQVQRGGE